LRKYPARQLAAITGIGLLLAGGFLSSAVELLVLNDIWRVLYVFAGLELLIITVTPTPGLALRASAASLATIVLIGRATALIVDMATAIGAIGALGTLSPIVAAAAWVIITAHTVTLMMFWPTLTNTYIER